MRELCQVAQWRINKNVSMHAKARQDFIGYIASNDNSDGSRYELRIIPETKLVTLTQRLHMLYNQRQQELAFTLEIEKQCKSLIRCSVEDPMIRQGLALASESQW